MDRFKSEDVDIFTMNHSFFGAGILICFITFLIAGAVAETTPSLFSPGLKAYESSKPYEDAYFKDRAIYAITHVTQPLPSGSDLLELKSVYFDIIMKNISPDYYNEARDITKYLFYIMKAADGIQQYEESTTGPGRVVMSYHEQINNQAKIDEGMAGKAWR
ncbi:MAG: hypothetical protein CVV33_10505, partial [Methanomicrobiales archaeon HGW-Methanomicrobiales-4]